MERKFIRRKSVAAVLLLALVVSALPAWAQGLEYIKANYTKHEYYVPMRDGVRLFTVVYLPKDRTKTYPIMLNRTPYSVAPYGADRYRGGLGPSPVFAQEGYIFVYQDVRGRWMSEGMFDHMRPHRPVKRSPQEIDESTDTYDSIEWLLKNLPNHNGRVGQWGISYPGFYSAAGMIDAHPALKAASPQAPVIDWHSRDDWHHNGALWLAHAFGWFSGAGWPFTQPTTVYPGPPPFERGTADGYEFFLRLGPVRNSNEKFFKGHIPFWNEMMKREAKDEFWQARNLSPHLKNIKPAVMTVGGWFDAENLYGALECYRSTEKNSPGAFNILVMGPWVHGGWAGGAGDSLGAVRFDAKTAEFYREKIEFPFFEYYLKDKGKLDLPEAYVFETGTNLWRRMDAWPPKQTAAKSLYLHASGKLAFDQPKEESGAFDEYVSDPAKPVPLTTEPAGGMPQTYMIDDQRHAARRTDVLVYQTDVLEEDVTMVGPILPSLFVSTTGTDSDWVVKLIDVYPDRYPDAEGRNDNRLGGYQQLVRGDVLRGKFRNSLEKPEPFEPGKPTKIEFVLDDIYHTFRRGHRIMVQVQSSWFPLMNLNPQKFVQINEASEADFQKATQRVYRSRAMPSQIRVGILPPEAKTTRPQ